MGYDIELRNVSDFLASSYDNEKTREVYLGHLKEYFNCLYPELANHWNRSVSRKLDPEEKAQLKKEYWRKLDVYSLLYVQDGERNYGKDLEAFANYNKDLAPRTKATRLFAVFKFLEKNGHRVPKPIKDDVLPTNTSAISEEKIPYAEDLRKIMQHLTLPEKALVYFLTASGMRIGEALAVEIDMINFKETPTVITLPARITKGKKKKRITFLTEEATKILKEWLEYRTEYGLRASEKKEGYTFNPLKDKRVFPFQNQTFSSKWQDALEKAGYGQKDEETGRYLLTPHKLRKFFRTRGAWRNADTPEGLMGRISRYNSTYDIMIEKKDELAQEYLDAELSLSLDDSTQILRESEEERLKYQARIDDVLRNNEIKVAQLENKIFDLTAKVSDQQNLMRDQMEYFKTEMTQMNDKFAQLTKLLLGEDDQPPIDPEGLRARATKTMKEFQQSRRE